MNYVFEGYKCRKGNPLGIMIVAKRIWMMLSRLQCFFWPFRIRPSPAVTRTNIRSYILILILQYMYLNTCLYIFYENHLRSSFKLLMVGWANSFKC